MTTKLEGVVYLAAVGLGVYVAVKLVSAAKSGAGAVVDAINPASPNNIVAKAANSIVQTVTGDPNATVGTKLWEWTHADAPKADAPVQVGAGRVSPNAAALVAQFGGDKLTRDDQAWMVGQLYGQDVQAADVDDAEQGQWFMASNPAAMSADRLRYAVKP